MIKTRLSMMMFLQYAVWGAWLPVIARFLSAPSDQGGLGLTGGQIGMILGLAGSIGAVSSPFIAGQLADRYFRTDRFLAVLVLLGGILKWVTASQTSYRAWLLLSIAYSIVYMPTLALSNSLAFAHLEDPKSGFPLVRVWGTLGWIAASWIFPMIWLQTDLHFQAMPPFLAGPEVPDVTGRLVDALKFSGLISIGYAVFCLFLPATPPKKEAAEKLAFAKAFALLGRPSFRTLVIASLFVSIIHQIYFLQAGPFLSSRGLPDSSIGPAMTVGQFAEIFVMAALGGLIARLGFKKVILIGGVSYVLRYAIWGTLGLPLGAHIASQVLHGTCYACFFAAAYIYVDKLAEADIKHSAQTVFGIIILGGGPVIGGWLNGRLQEAFTTASAEGPALLDYSRFWYTLSGMALLMTVYFAASFKEEAAKDDLVVA